MTVTTTGTPRDPDPVFTDAWEAWHRAHEQRRADPLGYLAIVGLYWLGSDPLEAPGAPGRWWLEDDGPVVRLAGGEGLSHGADRLTGTHHLGPLLAEGPVLLGYVDDGVIGVAEVARRGDGIILRSRRSDSLHLAHYTGTPTYPADPRWAVPARLVAADAPVSVGVGSVVPGIGHEFDSPGVLEFELPAAAGTRADAADNGGDGHGDGADVSGDSDHDDGDGTTPRTPTTHRLTAFSRGPEGGLSVLFRDATSGVTTDGASRSVAVDAPDAEGWTVLDLNRSVNLPCAYNDFSTCPLPPPGNSLSVPVEAGEKLPLHRAESLAWEPSSA